MSGDSSDFRDKRPVIAVVGPTATGKTAVAVDLAKHYQTEIISADSKLVYRDLTIGTAKPTGAEKQGIPHHLIDVSSPTESYTVALYEKEATVILKNLLNQEKLPVVAGGTGFYIRALLQEDFVPDAPPDETFRAAMNQQADHYGSMHLHQLLEKKDPERAAMIHPHDRFRIIRALEIIHQTGQLVPKPSEVRPKPYHVIWIGLTYADRNRHRQQIDARIDAMIKAGWVDEVACLLKQYGPDIQAFKMAHGYPEWAAYLQNRCTYEEALERIRINIHQYARRQRTWFRRNKAIHWFAMDDGLTLEERFQIIRQTIGKQSVSI